MTKSLSQLLKNFPQKSSRNDENLEELQYLMLRIQQGVYLRKERVIIMFEGFDAAGKGGTIKKITEKLDPRGFRVHPIGAPTPNEQGIHWLYRFWTALPAPGNIAIFDRSWYGRVLVEKVDGLTPKEKLKDAHDEINEFEKTLINDGIILIKVFLAITKDEQLKRFEERLKNPYKFWKITEDDILARKKWTKYVMAMDEILKKNNSKLVPWFVIPANSKSYTREKALRLITNKLKPFAQWIEKESIKLQTSKLQKQLNKLK
jgi:polyphosphate kinase 2 (PPK2 family)